MKTSKRGQKRPQKARKKLGTLKRGNVLPAARAASKNGPLPSPSPGRTPSNLLPKRVGGRILVDRIDRETVLGDLIVAFPWTREVLRKYGLRLEVEEAGDIYMSVEAFAALRNLKSESLIRELVDASKQPPQPPQPVPPLVTTVVT